MNSEQYERARELFFRALEIPTDERHSFVRRECGSDTELLEKLLSLLAQDTAGDFLAEPVLGDTLVASELERHLFSEPTLQIPEEIGPYRVVRVISNSTMATVYQGHPRDSQDQTVAIKVLRPGPIFSPHLKRFQTEANILRHLRHEGIAKPLDDGNFDRGRGSEPYVVMEYIEGKQLLEHCKQEALSTTGRLRLLVKIADAVHAAHQQGVIHRDLKPTNILVDQSGNPKIVDFGIARTSNLELKVTEHLTVAGEFLGTIHYMSPEQVYGSQLNVDVRSDLYALGVVGYNLLAETPPYSLDGCSRSEQIQRIRETPPAPICELNSTLSQDLELVLLKCLEKDKGRRYESVASFATDLKCILHGKPISLFSPSTIHRIRTFARENRGFASIIATGMALLLIFLVVSVMVNRILKTHYDDERLCTLAKTISLLADTHHYVGRDDKPAFLIRLQTAKKLALTLIEETDDPRASACLGDVYLAEADIFYALPEHQKAAEKAGMVYKELTEKYPDTLEYSAKLSICLVKQGNYLETQKDYKGAESLYCHGLSIDEKLVTLEPENVYFLDNLTWSYNRLGELRYRVYEDHFDANDYFEKQLKGARELLNKDVDRTLSRLTLFVALHRVAGYIHNLFGRHEEALKLYREAHEHATKLTKEDPDKDLYKGHYIQSCLSLSGLERTVGNSESSLPLLQEALATAKSINASHIDFARILSQMANHHVASENLDLAETCATEALWRCQLFSTRRSDYLRLAQMHGQVAWVLMKDNRQPEAMKHASEYIALLREHIYPPYEDATTFNLDMLAVALLNTAVEELRNPEEALVVARAAVKKNPRSYASLILLGQAHAANNHQAEAVKVLQGILDDERCPPWARVSAEEMLKKLN